MKTCKKSPDAPSVRLAHLALAATLLACPALLLHASPDQEPAEESAGQLAERIREDLEGNRGALQDLIRRAMENGGQLQLDAEEFQKLMQQPKKDGPDANATRKELQEFLKEMRAGGRSRALSPDEAERLLGGLRNNIDDESEETEAEKDAKGDVVKGFMEMFQRQLSGRKAGTNEREHSSIMAEYRPVIEQARKSTVGLLAGRKQLALGTVVDAGGYIITKASEVKGMDLRCVFSNGLRVGAKVVDVYEPLDLALVQVDADGLEPVEWHDSGATELGSFLASPGIGDDPIAIGVASVAPRSLSDKNKGYLGVAPEGSDDGVRIAQVLKGTPAADSGLEVGDIVLEIDDNKLTSRAEFHRLVAGHRPGDDVRFKIRRGDEEKTLTAKLASREAFAFQNGGGEGSSPRIDRMNLMGGNLSENRGGYPAALQTDLTLNPDECGGPLVNLDGHVIGVNIARGGRVNSYAVPSSELKALLGDVKSGKFTVTDLSVLESAAAAADEAFKTAEAALEVARAAKEAADKALKDAAER